MLLKNWYILRALKQLYITSEQLATPMVRYDGTTPTTFYPHYSQPIGYLGGLLSSVLNAASYQQGVLFGDGNAAVTINDHCLSGNVIPLLSTNVVISKTNEVSDSALIVKARYTITNVDSTDITIREVGLMEGYRYYNGGSDAAILVERTVLDTPVTIPAGGIGQVEYTITYNYPTATTETN